MGRLLLRCGTQVGHARHRRVVAACLLLVGLAATLSGCYVVPAGYAGPGYAAPGPMYAAPGPVYVAPAPVYVRPYWGWGWRGHRW